MPTAHVLQRPWYYSFSKNQLTWRFYLSSPSDVGCKLQFKLMADSASDIAAVQRIYETELRPTSDGYLNVTVHDIVDSMIDLSVPVVTTGNVIVGQNMKIITILFRRVSDADPDPDWDDSEPPVYVIKGGIELLKHDYNNYFYNYHGPNKVFATWLPKNRFVSIADEWWMSILFTNNDINEANLAARKLRTLLEYTDGTSDTTYDPVPSTGFAFLLYHFNVGKIVMDAVDPDKILWRLTVQVVANSDESVLFSEAHTMYPDYRQFYDYKIFNYYNSLGGLDHVRILAESEESYTRGFIEADLFANTNTAGSPADQQYFQANFSRLNSTKSDIGYRHTKAETLAYQEILTSELIFEIWPNSNKYRLIDLLNKSNKLIKTTDKRFGFYIEWRYPFVEQVYTPEVPLGVAYVPCIAIAILGSPALPDAQIDVPYDFSFDITGSWPAYLSGVTKPSWMTITLLDVTVHFAGTPDTEATNVEVEFDINNCSGVPAHFEDTIDVAVAPPELIQLSVTNTGPGGTRTQVFQVGFSVNAGNSFYVTVYGHTITVVAVGGDTPTTIATAMKNAVNATTEGQWNDASSAPLHGTPGFKPIAISSGDQFTIVLNYQNQFAFGAS